MPKPVPIYTPEDLQEWAMARLSVAPKRHDLNLAREIPQSGGAKPR
ncbi:hypothetical protein J3E64_000914 [Sphingobium sp. OAS761]|nr:hypothetical protein [Sphingobium sp. OAS761]MCP1469239.1 hypothetical protein [Sphingobium sp. OAS761]